MNKYAVWYDWENNNNPYRGGKYTVYAQRVSNRVIAVFLPQELATGFDSGMDAAQFYAASQGIDEFHDDVLYQIQEEAA